jgi:hypothetical protein
MKQSASRSVVLLLFILFLAPHATRSEDCVRCRLADELKQLIVRQISSHELTVDPEADKTLNAIADHAARELESDRFDDAKVNKAKENAAKLGAEIAVQASAAQSSPKSSAVWLATGGRVVTRVHILAALKKLCPIYPFC